MSPAHMYWNICFKYLQVSFSSFPFFLLLFLFFPRGTPYWEVNQRTRRFISIPSRCTCCIDVGWEIPKRQIGGFHHHTAYFACVRYRCLGVNISSKQWKEKYVRMRHNLRITHEPPKSNGTRQTLEVKNKNEATRELILYMLPVKWTTTNF